MDLLMAISFKTLADCRAGKVSSIKKERREPLFFAFMGKDATRHRRP
jgi:hypothetical protein